MPPSRSSLLLCGGLLLAGTAAAVPLARPRETVAPAPVSAEAGATLARKLAVGRLQWAPDWEAAQRLAARENRPVLAYFHSPLCHWCLRMDEETFAAPEVRRRLEAFVLVRVDILADERTAARFRIRSTPTLLFLGPEGRESSRLEGFAEAAPLVRSLDGLLANRIQSADQRFQTLLAHLGTERASDDDWSEVVAALGDERRRAQAERAVFALQPAPREALVRHLRHPLLAIRLGALELLEELAGDDFGFDPWCELPGDNAAALAAWQEWAKAPVDGAAARPALFRVLAPAEIGELLADLLGDDEERAQRAHRRLAKDPDSTLEGIEAYAGKHPELPAGSVRKLRELRYALLLPSVDGLEAASVAHRLVFGNLDVRLGALRAIAAARQRAVPVIAEFLDDPEPLVRETAVDALVATGGREAVALLDGLLEKETDANVVYVVLRQLGNLRSKKGLRLLQRYLGDANEDFVIVALESIAKLRVEEVAGEVGACLKDPRWRVRTAALQTAETLTLKALAPQVVALLDDPDEFVRGAAVATLAKLGVGDALPRLESIFAGDDAVKGPILRALAAEDRPVPESMLRALAARPVSVRLGVLDGIERVDKILAPVAVAGAADPDPDLACASLRLLAASGLEDAAVRETLVRQMEGGERRRQLAVMRALDVEDKVVARYNPAARKAALDQAPVAASSGPDPLADVFAAFDRVESGAAAKPAVTADDLFAAFGAETAGGENFVDALRRAGQRILAAPAEPELREAAGRMLVVLGDSAGVAACLDVLPHLDEARRAELARQVSRVRNRDGVPLIRALLRDSSPEVRRGAVRSLLEGGADLACVRLLLEEMERPDASLHPAEAFSVLGTTATAKKGRAEVQEAVHRWLREARFERLRTLALSLLPKVWTAESEACAVSLLAADDPWQRRAAYLALGRGAPSRFIAEVGRAGTDTAEGVREIVPHLCLPPQVVGSSFTHVFDERTRDSEWVGGANERRALPALPETALQVLRTLAQDPSERVRFLALFALIARRQPVELDEVVRLLERMPRDSELLEQFSSFVAQEHAALGREFAVVLPYLQWESVRTNAAAVRRHFGVMDDEGAKGAAAPARVARRGGGPIGSYVAVPVPEAAAAAVPPENYRVVFFTKPGCKECAAVARRLEQLREAFPEVEIVEHDIGKTASMLLNEALGERFGVPVAVRLVAPTVFCGGGYLVKNDITVDRLGPMLARAARVPVADWLVTPKRELAAAHAGVVERYETTALGVVLLAGLLDGVNPCAFATIIFLLSYLQVSRRTPRQMLQVGAAYVAGVFATYFTIGLGLAQVATALAQLRWAGPLTTYAMAAFALTIAALNVRDGFRCRRGALAEMTLQLPGFLKERIRRLIRHGVRQAHFVLLAAVVGAAISVLELACTGQVYLPTITYMIQQGETGAVGRLLAYNLAFIVPLTTVFVLAYRGLHSEVLVRLLKRRAAWVKFTLAGFFLLLSVLLVFGGRP